tara:strand:- start:9135 stop:9428 length:294 start_codon:yes stop_codon:yes gene_type:complete
MDLLDNKLGSSLNQIYVLEENAINSYNPLILSKVRKVPVGFYLLQTLKREDGTIVYELVPKDRKNVSMLDVHYIEGFDLRCAFGKGHATFTTEQGEA